MRKSPTAPSDATAGLYVGKIASADVLRESIAKGLEEAADTARENADRAEDTLRPLLAVEARTLGIIAVRVRAGEWG